MDPDAPTGDGWLHLVLEPISAPLGDVARITMWKRGTTIVIAQESADQAATAEVRVGRTADSRLLFRERDDLIRAQTLRISVARERVARSPVYASALAYLYGEVGFDAETSAGIESVNAWLIEGRRIARDRGDAQWDARVEVGGAPPPVESVADWHWEEYRHLTLAELRAATNRLVPARVGDMPLRDAFVYSTSAWPVGRLHMHWGEAGEIEMVVDSTADDHNVAAAPAIETPRDDYWRVTGSARSVALLTRVQTESIAGLPAGLKGLGESLSRTELPHDLFENHARTRVVSNRRTSSVADSTDPVAVPPLFDERRARDDHMMLVAAFDDESSARAALDGLARAYSKASSRPEAVILIASDNDGHVVAKNMTRLTVRSGVKWALFGAALGVALSNLRSAVTVIAAGMIADENRLRTLVRSVEGALRPNQWGLIVLTPAAMASEVRDAIPATRIETVRIESDLVGEVGGTSEPAG